MKTQIRKVVLVACMAALVPIGVPTAQAKDCSAARPSDAREYWSWRLIDGRKCWYAGKAMIPKSLLQWPAEAPEQAKADAAPGSVDPEKRGDPMDAQAQLLDGDNSFESRWRARVTNE